jgi:prepilin-type N-terminal cleavage/methylation domain-containing protein
MESSPVLTEQSTLTRRRGFTLVEMLVVLAIIAVITTIVVTGQSNYNKTLLLTDTSYTVALSARQAQSYGLASRKYGSVQNPGYGLHFNSATKSSYLFFADTAKVLQPAPNSCPPVDASAPVSLQKPGNCRYDATDGVVNTYAFSRGFTIQQFCGKQGSGPLAVRQCSTDAVPLTTLDMVFTRPNTSTTISGLLNGSSLSTFTCAEVTLADATGQATRTIRISQLGEVSLNQSCP